MLERQYALLHEELRTTSQRVNLFEKVKIPECRENIRVIRIFLGDEQSLEDHLSTFTAQIRHLSRVWPEVDDGTLVLLDEVGAGTDPSQGAALAQAVVDGLRDRGA